jgi:hypothetical protein
VPNFFVTTRRRERIFILFFCHYFYNKLVENMIKGTDCYELEIIRGMTPSGDEDIWAIKLYSGRMQIQTSND